MTKVSVCIPAYNQAKYTGIALDSILAQDFDDYEVVISDDASTDNTPDICKVYEQRDRRIKYYRNDRNCGQWQNYLRCTELAKGEYIKPLHADDKLHPSCLSEMVRALDEHPNVSLVASPRQLIDSQGNLLGRAFGIPWKGREYGIGRKGVIFGKDAINIVLSSIGGNVIGEPTAVMFRKRDAVMPNPLYGSVIDLSCWFNLLETGDLYELPKPRCFRRIHAEQYETQVLKTGIFREGEDRLFRDYINKSYIRHKYFKRMLFEARMKYIELMARRAK